MSTNSMKSMTKAEDKCRVHLLVEKTSLKYSTAPSPSRL